MDEVATKIIEILKKHMKEPRDDISASTPLTDLKIESLDLAMIVFDIEDTFGIEIPYNANEEVERLQDRRLRRGPREGSDGAGPGCGRRQGLTRRPRPGRHGLSNANRTLGSLPRVRRRHRNQYRM